MFFSDAAFPSRMLFPLFPMDLPGSSIFATAPRPASIFPITLCHSAAILFAMALLASISAE